jgi:UDP-2,4-diacetamido-2,4,6-trideoxy-beta-L-altropyranose hydrolase
VTTRRSVYAGTSSRLNVVFRVDASVAIGIGHITRCLTLAEVLRERGIESQFICRMHAGHRLADVESMGLPFIGLPAPKHQEVGGHEDTASWLGVTQDEDAAECMAALGKESPDWIVADHYGLDAQWESTMRSRARHLMAIDDLENRTHACDLLLNQNFSLHKDRRYAGLVPVDCRLLMGPRYALLRPEYARRRRYKTESGSLGRVFVFFGGSDPYNLTGAALEALSRPGLRHLTVDVVVGVNNVNRQQLQTQASERPNTSIHGPLPNLAELMSAADLAIGAAGTTTWERMCLGVPSLVVCTAENQRATAEALAQKGLIQYLGSAGNVGISEFVIAVEKVVTGKVDLAGQSLRGSLAVDGLGAMRVAECIDPTDRQQLSLRAAQAEDAGLLFNWANDPEVRRQSLNTDEIPWLVHRRWFQSKLEGHRSRIFILQAKSLPVGQIRFDMDEGAAQINFSIDSEFRGRGWGRRLVALGVSRMTESGRIVFRAEVKHSNPASASVFARLGFRELPARNGGDLAVFQFDSGLDTLAEIA